MDRADRDLIDAPDGLLNDRVIDAVNKLVRDQIGGDHHQSTLLAQLPKGFATVISESIYVLHDNNHWVTTACIGDEVLFADSLGGGVSSNIRGQMRQLYGRQVNSATGKLEVKISPCPRQGNAADCGVYAAAVAFEWATGNPKLPMAWDVHHMRPHLIQCLEARALVRFAQGPVKRGRRPKATTVSI